MLWEKLPETQQIDLETLLFRVHAVAVRWPDPGGTPPATCEIPVWLPLIGFTYGCFCRSHAGAHPGQRRCGDVCAWSARTDVRGGCL